MNKNEILNDAEELKFNKKITMIGEKLKTNYLNISLWVFLN